METRHKVIIGSTLLVAAFAFGRYSVKPQTITKVKEVIKHQVIVRIKHPDGTSETTITTDKETKEKAVTSTSHSKANISALGGVDVTAKLQPIYGIAINKEFIGPITIGAFGLTNGVVGLSIGMNF